jgi:hypothetical protein
MTELSRLLQELEGAADPAKREPARRMVQAVLEVHRLGLARVMEHLRAAGEAGQRLLEELGTDPGVAALLLLHDLHPLDTAARVNRALAALAGPLAAQGWSVRLDAVTADSAGQPVARLVLVPAGEAGVHAGGLPPEGSSRAALRAQLEVAVLEWAPELAAVTLSEPEPDPARCDLCAAPILPRHAHLVVTGGTDGAGDASQTGAAPQAAGRRLRCACGPCALLFERPPAAGSGGESRLLRVPTDVHRWAAEKDELRVLWDQLGIPVGLAFVMARQSGGGAAVYPGAAGCIESPVEVERWNQLCCEVRALGALQAEVEALLVDRRGPSPRAYRVPIDECYRLAGYLRSGWRGLSGGPELSGQVNALLAELESRAAGEVGAR